LLVNAWKKIISHACCVAKLCLVHLLRPPLLHLPLLQLLQTVDWLLQLLHQRAQAFAYVSSPARLWS
jgi:hypothetical protein